MSGVMQGIAPNVIISQGTYLGQRARLYLAYANQVQISLVIEITIINPA